MRWQAVCKKLTEWAIGHMVILMSCLSGRWFRPNAEQQARGEQADEGGDGGGEDERQRQPVAGKGRDSMGVDANCQRDEAKADGQQRSQPRPAYSPDEEHGQREQDDDEIDNKKNRKEAHGCSCSLAA